MTAALQSLAAGFPYLLAHLGAATVIFVTAAFAYVKLTPYREIDLIRSGNTAAAVSLGAVLVGLALPLAAALATSAGIWDIFVWGAATLLIQLLAFRFADLILRELPRRIADGETPAAIVLASIKLSGGVMLAAALMS